VLREKEHLWQRSVDHREDAAKDQPRKMTPRRRRMPRSMVENTASTVMPIVRIAIMRAIMYGVSLSLYPPVDFGPGSGS